MVMCSKAQPEVYFECSFYAGVVGGQGDYWLKKD